MTRRAFRSGVGRLAAATDPGPALSFEEALERQKLGEAEMHRRRAAFAGKALALLNVDEIRRVAEDVNPLAVFYGQTAWLAEDATVLWVSGDGTSDEQVDEAAAKFLAIDGVDGFVHEAEGMPAGWCDAEVVYGGDPFAERCAENASLRASAAETLDTGYNLDHGSLGERFFYKAVLAAGHRDVDSAQWPTEADTIDYRGSVFRGAGEAVYRTADGTLAHVYLGGGWISVRVAAADHDLIAATVARFAAAYPASFVSNTDDGRIPITFWGLSPLGPNARLRRIEAPTWDTIGRNYTAAVQAELGDVMAWQDGPDVDGQLLLWHGPPGTGKTYALRALAAHWAPWAEFHYITDPDRFFGEADYMNQVLLAESYSAIDVDTGDVYADEKPDGKWRVLILEDTGELLSANAKETQGQGLSRLLNVVDGLLGQGLRVLAIVTTNEQIESMHPAVTRPGRCASQLEFGPLSDQEAREWCGDPEASAGTLAELYARGAVPPPDSPIGVSEPLTAALNASELAVDAEVAALVELARSPLPPDPE